MQRSNRSLVLFLLGTLTCVLAVGPAAWSEDAAEKQADDLFEKKHYAEAATAYRSAHAIFVRQGARTAKIAPDEVPEVLASRLISMRLLQVLVPTPWPSY